MPNKPHTPDPRPIKGAQGWTQGWTQDWRTLEYAFNGEVINVYEPCAHMVLHPQGVFVIQGHETLSAYDLHTGKLIAEKRTR
jgi:hypothetical protein